MIPLPEQNELEGIPWVGVDLDGTLAKYEQWGALEHIGEPVPLMVERVLRWLSEGVQVKVFTARVHGLTEIQLESFMKALDAWCLEHVGVTLPATCEKDFFMLRLYDDRCVQVESNTGRLIGAEEE